MNELDTLLQSKIPSATDGQRRLLIEFYEYMIERNKTLNLTRIVEPEDFFSKHYIDSLLPLEYGLIPQGADCIDVGTGAGFPGVPLLIMRPDIRLTLLDSLNKRILFLKEALDKLGLSARLIHARAEDAGHDPLLREMFDVAFTRAVAPIGIIAELTLPFLRVGGASLAYKGNLSKDELDGARGAFSALHGKLTCFGRTMDYGERCIAKIEKQGRTSDFYPRKPDKKREAIAPFRKL